MRVQIRYDRLAADIDRALVHDNVPPAERERLSVLVSSELSVACVRTEQWQRCAYS